MQFKSNSKTKLLAKKSAKPNKAMNADTGGKKQPALIHITDPQAAAKISEAGFGFQKDGITQLHPLEATYLCKLGWLPLPGGIEKYLEAEAKKDPLFTFAFAAYFSVRKTGRLVRPYLEGSKYLRIYAPGVGREETRPSVLMCLIPGDAPSPKTISEEIKVAHLARLDLIIACGTEKEMRFYKISSFNF